MYNIQTVIPQLTAGIGFRQPLRADIKIDADLIKYKGRRIDDIQTMLVPELIHASAPNFIGASTPAWEATYLYEEGYLQLYTDKKWYRALKDNTGVTPGTDKLTWKETSPFSEWLRTTIETAAGDAIIKIWNRGIGKATTPAPPVETKLFAGEGNVQDKIIGLGRVVGLKITPKNLSQLLLTIKRVALQITRAQVVGVPIYLYHSTRPEAPIATYSYTSESGYRLSWADTVDTFKLSSHELGGAYYLFYREADIDGMAINTKRNFAEEPCGTCIAYNTQAFNTYNTYLKIESFSVDGAEFDGAMLWSPEKEKLVHDKNWGLNLHMAFECDLSDWIIGNKKLFSQLVELNIGIKFLEQMTFNTRDNKLGEEEKTLAMYALRGSQGEIGLQQRFDDALDKFKFDTKGMNSLCFPKDTGTGVKMGYV